MLYRSKMRHRKSKKTFQIFDPQEFIIVITQHIPEKSLNQVRYYGLHSSRMRGDCKKQEQTAQGHDQTVDDAIIDVRSCKPRRIPPLMWRECIKKIWEVGPLICIHGDSARATPALHFGILQGITWQVLME